MRLRQEELALAGQFAEAGVESPRLCAQVLLGHVLHLDRLHLHMEPQRILEQDQVEALAGLARRLCRGEPLAYLTGSREFYGREFHTTAATLIPRPETELLVELALAHMPEGRAGLFVDLGTGSGCIGISLQAERPNWHGILVDNSKAALRMAQKNAKRHGANGLALLQADMFHLPLAENSIDVCVSNPPYIGEGEQASVMPAVFAHEPHNALFSEQEGLAHILSIIRQGAKVLRAGGMLFLEHGAGQGQRVRQALAENGYAEITGTRDLAGLDRCSHARWQGHGRPDRD